MKANLSRFMRSRSFQIYKNQTPSPSKIKLRTILKSRSSKHDLQQKNDDENYKNELARQQKEIKKVEQGKRISKTEHFQLPNSNQFNDNLLKKKHHQLANTINKLQSMSIQKDRINKLPSVKTQEAPQTRRKVKSQNQIHMIEKQLSQLNSQADQLIRNKILQISKKSHIITLKNKGKDEISQQIDELVRKIRDIKFQGIDKGSFSQEKLKYLMDYKIRILEKLLAENSTESQVLKKYYFAISAINQKNKSSRRHSQSYQKNKQEKRSIILKLKNKYEHSKHRQIQAVCNQSCNSLEYHSPKPNQYETYRYKNKDYIANMQPFPRSSYKRQFLLYDPNSQNMSCKNFDNHTFLKSRMVSSTYANDFQKLKTQIFDYKQLDSYRNKFKNIQISYINRNKKEDQQEYMQKNRKYITEQLKMRYNQKNLLNMHKKHMQTSPIQSVDNAESVGENLNSSRKSLINRFLSTQFKSQFKGTPQLNVSNIKNRELNNLKYSYKNLINSS